MCVQLFASIPISQSSNFSILEIIGRKYENETFFFKQNRFQLDPVEILVIAFPLYEFHCAIVSIRLLLTEYLNEIDAKPRAQTIECHLYLMTCGNICVVTHHDIDCRHRTAPAHTA